MEYTAEPIYICIHKGIDMDKQIDDKYLHITESKFCPYCNVEHECYIVYGNDILIDNNKDSPTYYKIYSKPVAAVVCTKNGEKRYFQNMDTQEYSNRNPMYEITNNTMRSIISNILVNEEEFESTMDNKKNKSTTINDDDNTISYEDEVKDIKERINSIPSSISVGEISDRYHTFNELYHHRALLFASLCMTTFRDKAWKSLLHDDPENNPMYNGMFIVGVDTPSGQATYHYDIYPYWNIFKVKEVETAPKFDGHTPNDAIDRLYKYAMKIAEESSVTINIKDGPYGYSNIVPCADYGKTGGVPNFNTYYTGSTITD